MNNFFKYSLVTAALVTLTACGGGDSDSSEAGPGGTNGPGPVSANQPPVANAGEKINALVGQAITLDGSQSKDPENSPVTYKWSLVTKPNDSAVYLDDPEKVKAVLSNTRAGTYVAQLIVNDGTQDSAATTVTIEVEAVTVAPPRAPTAGELGFMKKTILDVFPNYLRSPSSFKLIDEPAWSYYNNIGKPTEGAFTFKYDATNGFGAVIRGTAICPAEWDARGFWRNKLMSDLRVCTTL